MTAGKHYIRIYTKYLINTDNISEKWQGFDLCCNKINIYFFVETGRFPAKEKKQLTHTQNIFFVIIWRGADFRTESHSVFSLFLVKQSVNLIVPLIYHTVLEQYQKTVANWSLALSSWMVYFKFQFNPFVLHSKCTSFTFISYSILYSHLLNKIRILSLFGMPCCSTFW